MDPDRDIYVDVAIALPPFTSFSYRVPPVLRGSVAPGCLVVVPFGSRHVWGIVISDSPSPPAEVEIKEIAHLVDEIPLFGPKVMEWFRWAAWYYLHPIGGVLRTALPPGFHGGARKILRPTPKGLEACAEGECGSPEFASLCRAGLSQPLASLAERWGEDRANSLVEGWRKRGWVEVLSVPVVEAIRPRRLRSARLRGETAAAVDGRVRLGRRQREILELLAGRGEMTVREMERLIPGAREAIKGLERRGLVVMDHLDLPRDPVLSEEMESTGPPELNPDQIQVLAPIEEALHRDRFKGFLLWGVTASGKTEVYLRASEACLKRKRQVMVLVPEISLTHQLVREYRGRFGDRIAVLHSRLSRGERWDMWNAIRRRQVSIVLGARSALFAPLEDPGLIIVDEEHEASYKQERGFRYQARDLALMRGKLCESVVILGSATPSIETFHNAKIGKITALHLPARVKGRRLPNVDLVDMRQQRARGGRRPIISPPLREAMGHALSKGEQVLLFLNRRGYATFLFCPDCGHVLQCANCSVTVVYHLGQGLLRCHYCGWNRPAPACCPECGGMEVSELGLGTETLESAVSEMFPAARVLRMDQDTTGGKHARRDMLRAWRRGEADVLIGTQMVAKGHHVPNVTLVGVILADITLNLPEFRAAERTFQLLTQVAGRAGRGEKPGRVIVQTYRPDNPSLFHAKNQDYPGFASQELMLRKEAGYPPYAHLVLFRISGAAKDRAEEGARRLAGIARRICSDGKGVQCLGPAPAPIARLKGRYRWRLMLKGASRRHLNQRARHIMEVAGPRLSSLKIRLNVDVDPYSFM